MKKIIGGKLYDTDNAVEICNVTPDGAPQSVNDFGFEDTRLYQTRKGAFFVAGEGGSRSRWSRTLSDGSTGAGDGLEPVADDDARELVEKYGDNITYALLFGAPQEA